MNQLTLLGLLKYNFTFLFFLGSMAASAQISIRINIQGFKNDKGKAFLRIRNEKDEIILQKVFRISALQVNTSEKLPAKGKYALEVFHDENNNQKLDTNLVGYPKEAWGVSNNIRPSFRGPTLEEMLVQVSEGSIIKIMVK